MSPQQRDDRGFFQRNAKRLVVGVVGAAVVIGGLFLLVLPGPGLLVIVAGLAILASEFDWAERWMNRLKDRAEAAAEKAGVSLKAVVAVGIFLAVVVGVVVWFVFR